MRGMEFVLGYYHISLLSHLSVFVHFVFSIENGSFVHMLILIFNACILGLGLSCSPRSSYKNVRVSQGRLIKLTIVCTFFLETKTISHF